MPRIMLQGCRGSGSCPITSPTASPPCSLINKKLANNGSMLPCTVEKQYPGYRWPLRCYRFRMAALPEPDAPLRITNRISYSCAAGTHQ